jgi:hypothetical protein
MESKMATEVLCYQLDEDETIEDALKQAIEVYDSPQLCAIRPFNKNVVGGLWVRDDLVTKAEMARAKADGRCYRDDRSTIEWAYHLDGT